jgi:hypothetical protein
VTRTLCFHFNFMLKCSNICVMCDTMFVICVIQWYKGTESSFSEKRQFFTTTTLVSWKTLLWFHDGYCLTFLKETPSMAWKWYLDCKGWRFNIVDEDTLILWRTLPWYCEVCWFNIKEYDTFPPLRDAALCGWERSIDLLELGCCYDFHGGCCYEWYILNMLYVSDNCTDVYNNIDLILLLFKYLKTCTYTILLKFISDI